MGHKPFAKAFHVPKAEFTKGLMEIIGDIEQAEGNYRQASVCYLEAAKQTTSNLEAMRLHGLSKAMADWAFKLQQW